MVIKIIMILGIILMSGLMGYMLSKYYIDRKKYFMSLQIFLGTLALEIGFNHKNLQNLIESDIASVQSEALKKMLYNFLNVLKNKEKLDEKTLFQNISIVKTNEKTIIFNFFNSLGKFDATNQSKEIEKHLKIIEGQAVDCKKEASKYASLYIKLGIIFGVFIVLIII